MDRFDRIFELHKLLSAARRPVSHQRIEQALECSRATATRTIEAMRLYLNAPIVYHREQGGYSYDHEAAEGGMYELPSVWFNAAELHALLAMRELLANSQPGLLEEQLAPIGERLQRMLDTQTDDFAQRIRILGMAARPAGDAFAACANAVAQRRRLRIGYLRRSDGEYGERELSPQRLSHYRDSWYLDAWCHRRDALRTFAVEQIRQARLLNSDAIDIPQAELNTHYAAAYGIFAGPADKLAVLRFSPQRAQWVAKEQWHPRQQGCWLDDGHYELRLPYGNPTELVMDILRHGPEVEVIEPTELRTQVAEQLHQALTQYHNPIL